MKTSKHSHHVLAQESTHCHPFTKTKYLLLFYTSLYVCLLLNYTTTVMRIDRVYRGGEGAGGYSYETHAKAK